jgi:hypothetical protein
MHGDTRPIDPATAEVPVSSGIPVGVRLALFTGILIVISIMAMTAGSSMVGHIWPWFQSMHVPLAQ